MRDRSAVSQAYSDLRILRVLRASSQSMPGSGRIQAATRTANALTSANADRPPASRNIIVKIYVGFGGRPLLWVSSANALTSGDDISRKPDLTVGWSP